MKRLCEPHLRFIRSLMLLPYWSDFKHEDLLFWACKSIWNMERGSLKYETMVTTVAPKLALLQGTRQTYEVTNIEEYDEQVQMS